MTVYIGSDHGGYAQKQVIFSALSSNGFSVKDLGPHTQEPTDDYPDYAIAVAKAVQVDPEARGILFCRSGEGMEMAANKVKGVRAALVWRPDVAAETRRDNNANVLVLPSDFVADHDAVEIAEAFLKTEFSGEDRHQRRLDKMASIEKGELWKWKSAQASWPIT